MKINAQQKCSPVVLSRPILNLQVSNKKQVEKDNFILRKFIIVTFVVN